MSTLWSASTPCPACGRDTATTEDARCHSCGAPKTADAEPEPVAAAPRRVAPSVWEDMRPQLVAAAISALIAVVGLLAGSTLLLLLAAAVLVVAAVAKIVADGW